MNNKKHRLFLLVGFAIFAISVIVFIVNTIISYNQIQYNAPYDIHRATLDFEFGIVVMGACVMLPFWSLELSCIRSVYKILKYAPKGFVKICYILSSCLSFIQIAFISLVLAGVISFEGVLPITNPTLHVLICTVWPVLILSFILGSMPVKKQKEIDKNI